MLQPTSKLVGTTPAGGSQPQAMVSEFKSVAPAAALASSAKPLQPADEACIPKIFQRSPDMVKLYHVAQQYQQLYQSKQTHRSLLSKMPLEPKACGDDQSSCSINSDQLSEIGDDEYLSLDDLDEHKSTEMNHRQSEEDFPILEVPSPLPQPIKHVHEDSIAIAEKEKKHNFVRKSVEVTATPDPPLPVEQPKLLEQIEDDQNEVGEPQIELPEEKSGEVEEGPE